MKTDLNQLSAQLHLGVAQLWRGAGASDSFDGMEVLLTWLAFVRLNKVAPDIGGELTAELWDEVRSKVARALDLPPYHPGSNSFAFRTPGLLEQTRRIADAAAHVVEGKSSKEFASAFLSCLMHTAQIGKGRFPIGLFQWPANLAHLFCALIGKPSREVVYVPFDSSGPLPLVLASQGWSVECEIANVQTARIFSLLGFIAGWSLKVNVADALMRPSLLDGLRLKKFHRSAAVVTFGLRLRDETDADPHQRFPVKLLHGEARQIAHLIAQTRGRVVVIVPEGFLFRSAGGERDYKEHLVRRGVLSAVIRLPKSTFSPGMNVQASMLVFETGGKEERDVLFIDASELLSQEHGSAELSLDGAISRIANLLEERAEGQFSATADYDAIREQDFNISVDRYVRSDEELQVAEILESAQTVELGDIAEVIRPQSFASEGTDAAKPFCEITLSDIESDGLIKAPSKRVEIGERHLGKLSKQRVEQGDVLVSVRGRIGAVGMVRAVALEKGVEGWLASQAFVIVRLRETSPVEQLALYRYLSSPIGQATLLSVATGATVPMVSMGDVKKLRVIVPSKAEQARIEADYREFLTLKERVRELEAKSEALLANAWPMKR